MKGTYKVYDSSKGEWVNLPLNFKGDGIQLKIEDGHLKVLYSGQTEWEVVGPVVSENTLTVDNAGVLNRSELKIGNFEVLRKDYGYSIELSDGHTDYGDPIGFQGNLVGETTVNIDNVIIPVYEFDCDNIFYDFDTFTGKLYIPVADVEDLYGIESNTIQPDLLYILKDGGDLGYVRLEHGYNPTITRFLTMSARPSGTRCYINGRRVITTEDFIGRPVGEEGNTCLHIVGGDENNESWSFSVGGGIIALSASNPSLQDPTEVLVSPGQILLRVTGESDMEQQSIKITPTNIEVNGHSLTRILENISSQ